MSPEKILRVSGAERIGRIQSAPAEVLHLVPRGMDFPEFRYHGSTKDVLNRTEYFHDRKVTYHQLCIVRDEKAALDLLDGYEKYFRKLSEYAYIVLDLPGTFPKLTAHLKARAPEAKLVFRSHNAEFFHRLDWTQAEKGLLQKARFSFQALSGLYGDYQTVRHSDFVLSISDWDSQFYWRRLSQCPSQVITAPYFLPKALAPKGKSAKQKENLCVCLGTISKAGKNTKDGKRPAVTPLATDLFRRFSRLVNGLPESVAKNWRFAVTGTMPTGMRLSSRIEILGELETPYDILEKAKLVCQISDKGRGFKTKILDAVASKAYVALPLDLYERLPIEIMPFCLSLETERAEAFVRLLAKAEQPFPSLDVNEELRNRAYMAMDAVFKH